MMIHLLLAQTTGSDAFGGGPLGFLKHSGARTGATARLAPQ